MARYKFSELVYNVTDKKKPEPGDEKTYIGLEHLDPDSIYVVRYGSETVPKGEKLVMKKGDVLFGKRRAYQKKVAIAPFDGIFSAHGMVLRPNEDVIDKDFFPMFIKSDYFLDMAIKISVGSLSPTINWGDLKDLEFELPDIPKQKKLAELLWAIYDMKERYKKLLIATNELVKSQFIEMFGQNKRDKLGRYIEQIRGVSYKPADLRDLADDAYTLLRANNIGNDSLNSDDVQYVAKEKVSEKQLIRDGDILMCTSSGSLEHVGKTALCTADYCGMTFGAFCKLLRPIGKVSPKFLSIFFRTDEYRRTISDLACGSNINNLRNEHIDDLILPIPTEEQELRIIDLVNHVDKSKFELKLAIESADSLIRALMRQELN